MVYYVYLKKGVLSMSFYLKEINTGLYVAKNGTTGGFSYCNGENLATTFSTTEKAVNIVLNHSITDKFLDGRVFNIIHRESGVVVCDRLISSLKKADVTYTVSESEIANLETGINIINEPVVHSKFANIFLDGTDDANTKTVNTSTKKYQASNYTQNKLKDGLSSLQDNLNALSTAIKNIPDVDSLNVELGKCNSEVIDIIHYIEFTNLDACNGYLIFKKLQDVLIQRRILKEQIETLKKLTILPALKSSIDLVSEKISEEYIDSKNYVPRIDADLFETGIIK